MKPKVLIDRMFFIAASKEPFILSYDPCEKFLQLNFGNGGLEPIFFDIDRILNKECFQCKGYLVPAKDIGIPYLSIHALKFDNSEFDEYPTTEQNKVAKSVISSIIVNHPLQTYNIMWNPLFDKNNLNEMKTWVKESVCDFNEVQLLDP